MVKRLVIAMYVAALLTGPVAVMAQDWPWESPLDSISTSFSGPVATAVLTLAVIGLGFSLAFGAAHSVIGWALAWAPGCGDISCKPRELLGHPTHAVRGNQQPSRPETGGRFNDHPGRE